MEQLRRYGGAVPVPFWLDVVPVLDYFNPDRTVAMHDYREFVAAGVGREVSPWEHLTAQAFLGGSAFLQTVEESIRARKCSDQHPRGQSGYRAATIETVRQSIESMGIADHWPPGAGSNARLLFVLLAERNTNATRTQIGRPLGVSGSGVAYLFRVGLTRLQSDGAFAAIVREGEHRLGSGPKSKVLTLD